MIGTVVLPSFVAKACLRGDFALLGITKKVTAELVFREAGQLTCKLLFAFTDKATGQPITHFDEELTQELHVLAADRCYTSASSADGVRQLLHASVEIAMRN